MGECVQLLHFVLSVGFVHFDHLFVFNVDRVCGCCNFTGRHADGSLPVEDFNLELENQSGEKVKLGTEDDQRCN
ncbi:hypothetical protein Hanom_Chr08g00728841 [Helianthus anomalus]